MPELPEVETVRRGLAQLIVGREILNVKILNDKSFQNAAGEILSENSREIKDNLLGAKIVAARRRAKVLILDLSSKFSLVIHLKMTGQIVFRGAENWGGGHPTESFLAELPDRSTRVIFDLNECGRDDAKLSRCHSALVGESSAENEINRPAKIETAKLFFNDQRKFGWIKMVPTREIENLNFIKKLAPEMSDFSEILSENLQEEYAENSRENYAENSREKCIENPTRKSRKIHAKNATKNNEIDKKILLEFIKRARKHSNSPIKSVILNQEVAAGIGNIYADESLWTARVHPASRVKNLSDQQLSEIIKQAKIAMEKSLAAGGSTMKNYIKADGSRGDYLEKFANVFAKQGQPCPRCETEIIKIKIAGRGTHICLQCQVKIDKTVQ